MRKVDNKHSWFCLCNFIPKEILKKQAGLKKWKKKHPRLYRNGPWPTKYILTEEEEARYEVASNQFSDLLDDMCGVSPTGTCLYERDVHSAFGVERKGVCPVSFSYKVRLVQHGKTMKVKIPAQSAQNSLGFLDPPTVHYPSVSDIADANTAIRRRMQGDWW